jgi:hypothetical protein
MLANDKLLQRPNLKQSGQCGVQCPRELFEATKIAPRHLVWIFCVSHLIELWTGNNTTRTNSESVAPGVIYLDDVHARYLQMFSEVPSRGRRLVVYTFTKLGIPLHFGYQNLWDNEQFNRQFHLFALVIIIEGLAQGLIFYAHLYWPFM